MIKGSYILKNGEEYTVPEISRKYPPSEDVSYGEYFETVNSLSQDLITLQSDIKNKTQLFLNQKVIKVKMKAKKDAKSYMPDFLLVDKENMSIVGGEMESTDKEKRKIYYIKTNDYGLTRLYDKVSDIVDEESFLLKKNKSWSNDIATIEKIEFQRNEDKTIDLDYFEGNKGIEMVIHPIDQKNKDYSLLKDLIDLYSEDNYIKEYEDSEPIFASLIVDYEQLRTLSKINYVKSLAEINDFSIEETRDITSIKAPSIEAGEYKPSIKVGVFDGGLANDLDIFNRFSNNTKYSDIDDYNKINHGTNVSSLVLFGDLQNKERIPIPEIFLESFQVMPNSDKHNKYKAIDYIEKIVTSRPDIRIFNISFGPKISIIDKYIDRFTYSLDRLTKVCKDENGISPLFIVAVGNSGNRIQAPSDLVNGIGVGSYSYYGKELIKADYSCIGPGREGGKIKPDVLEYGGTEEEPLYAINPLGRLSTVKGTSFSAPLLTRKIAQLCLASNDITSHVARNLVIHTAEKKLNNRLYEGQGIVKKEINDILLCSDNEVTILYKGKIDGRKNIKVPILLPNLEYQKAKIKWTITTISEVNSSDSEAYTKNCIEYAFYPNSYIYRFTKEGFKDQNIDIRKKDLVHSLLSSGYKKSLFPVADSSSKKTEEKLKKTELKWDTTITKETSKMKASLDEPCLILKATGRYGNDDVDVEYFVAITIKLEKSLGNLYQSIIKNYDRLAPIKIQLDSEIKVTY